MKLARYSIFLLMLAVIASSCVFDKYQINQNRKQQEVSRLTEELRDVNSEVRLNALSKIGDIQDVTLYGDPMPLIREIASSDEDPIVRATAIKALGWEDREILLRSVKDDNPFVRAAAILRLTTTRGKDFYDIDLMMDSLDDPDKYVVEKVMESLIWHIWGQRRYEPGKDDGSSRLVPHISSLESHLGDDDINIRVLAAILLADLGVDDDAIVPILKEGLQNGDYRFGEVSSLRIVHVDWSQIASSLVNLINNTSSPDTLTDMVNSLESGKELMPALKEKFPDSYLTTFLEDKKPISIELIEPDPFPVGYKFVRYRCDGYPPETITILNYSDYKIKLKAIEALVNTEPTAEINDALQRATSDSDLATRMAAYEAMGEIGDKAPENLPFILKALDESEPDSRECGIKAAGLYGPDLAKAAMPYILSILRDDTLDYYRKRVAVEAVRGFGQAGIEAEPLLIEMLKKNIKDSSARYDIASSLLSIWSNLEIPPEEFKLFFTKDDNWVNHHLISFLVDSGPKSIPRLLQVFPLVNPTEGEFIEENLVNFISQSPDTVSDVLPYLHNPDESIREAVVTLLLQLGSVAKDALDELKDVAKNDESEQVREKASEAVAVIEGEGQ